MFSTHPKAKSVLELLLAAIVFYQLGACPCGCIEHSYWVQAFRGNDLELFPRGNVGHTLGHADDCDHSGNDLFLAERLHQLTSLRLLTTGLHVAISSDSAFRFGLHRNRAISLPKSTKSLAQPVRALIQVYLL